MRAALAAQVYFGGVGKADETTEPPVEALYSISASALGKSSHYPWRYVIKHAGSPNALKAQPDGIVYTDSDHFTRLRRRMFMLRHCLSHRIIMVRLGNPPAFEIRE